MLPAVLQACMINSLVLLDADNKVLDSQTRDRVIVAIVFTVSRLSAEAALRQTPFHRHDSLGASHDGWAQGRWQKCPLQTQSVSDQAFPVMRQRRQREFHGGASRNHPHEVTLGGDRDAEPSAKGLPWQHIDFRMLEGSLHDLAWGQVRIRARRSLAPLP